MKARARFVLLPVVVSFALAACEEASPPEGDLDNLVRWMTGSFSSEAQHEVDTTYADIRLEVTRIWPNHPDGVWLYVEQAEVSALDQPYRQRVYRVTQPTTGEFRSEVYEIPEPLRFAGAWQDSQPLASLTPDSLAKREGCAVILHWDGEGVFQGSTQDTTCKSSIRGASYATSEVTLARDRMISWDRGFNDQGDQVWGAREGPYVFRLTMRHVSSHGGWRAS